MITRHVLAALLVASVATCATAGGPRAVNGLGQPMKWSTAAPVVYGPDQGTLGLMTNAEARTLVAEAFAVWAAGPADITFVEGSVLPQNVDAAGTPFTNPAHYQNFYRKSGDGLSPVIFDNDGSTIDALFGEGARFEVLGVAGIDTPVGAVTQITEASIIINGAFFDGLGLPASPTDLTRTGLKAAIVHEIGHFINLDHTVLNHELAFDGNAGNDIYVPTMFPIAVDDEEALASTNPDDELAALNLYPTGAPASSLAGSVGAAGIPFQGANVVFRRTSDPLMTAYSLISGGLFFPCNPASACDPCHTACNPGNPAAQGAFAADQFAPGQYRVCVEQIDTRFALSNKSFVGPLATPPILPGPEECFDVSEGGSSSDDPDDVSLVIAGSAPPIVFALDALPLVDSFEPNNTLATGAALADLPGGQDTAPGILGAGDLDVFLVPVVAGQRVRIDVDAKELGSSLDAVLGLYDASNNLVARVDDAPDADSSEFSFDPAIELIAGFTGTAKLVISSYPDLDQDGIGGATNGPYWLRVEVVTDTDSDGAPDAEDICPATARDDADRDGVCFGTDNCPTESNALQDAPVKISGTLPANADVTAMRITLDGARVVFVADGDNDDVFELYSVPLNGGATPVKLNANLGATEKDVTAFRITRDSARVVYLADQDTDEVFELYSVPIAGGSVTKLSGTMVLGGDVLEFNISPNSASVVYRADQDTDGVGELFSVPTGGGTPVKLNGTLVAGGGIVQPGAGFTSFSFSSNSATVVYSADPDIDETFELFGVPIGGGTPVKLNGIFVAGGDIRNFDLDRINQRVVYAADQNVDEVVEIYSVPLSGGAATKLNGTLPPGATGWQRFRITEDGSTVVYTMDQDTASVYELYSIPIAGGARTKLSGTMVSGGDVFGIAVPVGPEDGDRMTYRADQDVDERFEIYSVPTSGGTVVKLNATLTAGGNVTAQGSGVYRSRVLYVADQVTDEQLEAFSVPAAGGTPVKVSGTMVPSGDFQTASFDDARIAVRADKDTDEVFELFGTRLSGGLPVKLNAPLVAEGDVTGFNFTSGTGPGMVVYLADQDTDEKFELYSRTFSLDTDADGVFDRCDRCPEAADPGQADTDGNGVGDACEACAVGTDPDADGVCGAADNCPEIDNVSQADFDGDGAGDACDADDDNDGLSDTAEPGVGTNPLDADSDDDGVSDGDEVAGGTNPNSASSSGTPTAFGPERVISVVSSPNSVFAADVDGDGDMDALAASQSGDKIEWYDNDGAAPPSFTVRTITASADGAQSVYAADVDGDGDIDALSASFLDDKIAWYENNGGSPPVWTAHTISTSADGAWSVHAADMDGDGDMDVLSASENDNKVAWYENDGNVSPSWTQRSISTTVTQVSSVFAADVDGDGDVDVLSASNVEDQIAWFENNGAVPPSWTERSITTAADGAFAVFAADVDGDGDLDALSASVQDNKIAWYENNGARPPGWTPHTISTAAAIARSVFAADADGDGDVDVFSASESDDKIAWYENNGAIPPAFAPRTITTGADAARSVVAADLDDDGDLDVLSAAQLGNRVAWHENRTIHRNAELSVRNLISSAVAGVVAVDAGDIDGDGDLDAIHASGQSDTIKWFQNDGASIPGWTARTVTTTALGLEHAELRDLDGDGDLDVLAASGTDDTVAWYENGGEAVPSWAFHAISLSQDSPLFVTAGDFDGDGDVDVVASSYADAKVSWYRNDGGSPPGFTEFAISTSPVSQWRRGLAAADVDRDGDVDIVAAAPNLGVYWYENDGAATPGWTVRVISSAFGLTNYVDVADINGDGDLDVVATEYTGNRVAWFENDGASNPSWTMQSFVMPVTQWAPVSAEDLDADGDVDIVASAGGNGFTWFENDGNDPPAWITRTIPTGGASIGAMAPADADGDGDVDVLVGSFSSLSGHRLEWYENRGGQFALATTSLAPASSGNGATVPLFAIDFSSRGRAGDADLELATLELLVTDGAGAVLSSEEANGLIERVRVYLDNGSLTFEAGSDTLVTTVEDLALSPLLIPFATGDPRVRLAPGQSKRLFVVVDATVNASSHTPNGFRMAYQVTSKARDASTGALLRGQGAVNVATPTVTMTGDVSPPIVTGVFPPTGAVDVAAHTSVVVFMSEPVDPSTVERGVTLSIGGLKVAGKAVVSGDGRILTFDPNGALTLGGSFQVKVSGALRDRSGNAAIPFVSSFVVTGDPGSGTIEAGTLGDESGGSVLEGASANDNSGFSAAALGDVNATAVSQGISDLIIGAPNADAGAPDAGEARLVFGAPGLQSGSGSVVSVTYRTGVAMDFVGETVARAGDLDADGIQDFLIGAPRSDQPATDAGVVYLIFGDQGIDEQAPGPLNLNNLSACASPTLCGVKFLGEAAGDLAGVSLSFAGDVNADGFHDLIIGAPGADPAGRADAGKVYLIYGPLAPGTIALSSVGSTTRGLVFRGEAAGDRVGAAVSPWQDRNSDGIDDLLLGAPGAAAVDEFGATILSAGYVYAVHGGTTPGHLVDTETPGIIELSRVANGASNQVAGMVFIGSDANGEIGRSLTGAIDTDGNGVDDILIAGNGVVYAIPGDGPKVVIGNTQTGGGTTSSELTRSIGGLSAIDDFGAVRYRSGDGDPLTVGSAGDLNRDGFDDFMIGAPLADAAAGADAGKAYVVLGSPAPIAHEISLADVGVTLGGFVVEGAGPGDNLGASVGGGFDLNADGVDDGLIGAPFADTAAGTPTNAGETYVISPLHPDEVVQLTLQKLPGESVRVEWSVTDLTASYNVYRGLLSALRSAGGVKTSAMSQAACSYPANADTDADLLPDYDDATPAPAFGAAFVYLVTARNVQGEGPLGAGTPTRVNDAQCP